MKLIKSIDKEKLIQLVTGIAGIYFCFFIGSIIHEYILKQKYVHRLTGELSTFNQISGLVAFERLIIWLYGEVYNKFTLPKEKRITLPFKNNILCATMSFIGFLTNAYAIAMVSFPIVMIFKSCSILSVIIIAVFCTRVTNKNLKLGGKKILVALAVSVGIIIFKVFDPQAKQGDQKKTQLWGLLILFVSLLADGFVPDFQAQIKSLFNPQPTVMMTEINKWCFVVSIIATIVTGQFIDFLNFMWFYPLLTIHMLSMCSLAFVGNIFVYTMIRNFKQHIVPFVITTRKIISVGLSVLFYKHETALLQMVGLILVFGTTIFEFITQISKKPAKQQQNIELDQSQKIQTQNDHSDPSSSPHKSIQLVREVVHQDISQQIKEQQQNYNKKIKTKNEDSSSD